LIFFQEGGCHVPVVCYYQSTKSAIF